MTTMLRKLTGGLLPACALALGTLNASAQEPVYLASANPADGSTVEQLQYITTTWGGVEISEWTSNSKQAVLVERDGEQVTTAKLRSVPSGVQIQLIDPQTEDGIYTVTIQAGMVGDVDTETFGLLAGTGNEETVLTYYIGSAVPAPEPVYLVSANPADGSTVEQLQYITTTWGGIEISEWTSNSKQAVSVERDGEEVTTAKLRSVPSGVQIQLIEAQTEPGEYTVTIKAGMVGDVDTETFGLKEGTGNEETVLHYTIGVIDGVAVTRTEPAVSYAGGMVTVQGMACAQVTVRDMAGRTVCTGRGDRVAADLAAGVYLITATDGTETHTVKTAVR